MEKEVYIKSLEKLIKNNWVCIECKKELPRKGKWKKRLLEWKNRCRKDGMISTTCYFCSECIKLVENKEEE